MKVTRAEWLAAQERIKAAVPSRGPPHPNYVASLTEAALDCPCPPDPEQVIECLATWIENHHNGVQVYRGTGLVVT